MINLILCVVVLKMYCLVRVEAKATIESHNCTKLLHDAGCDEKGHLLEENVCFDSDYVQSRPPNSSTTIYVGFLTWPRILDIDEGQGAIKLR